MTVPITAFKNNYFFLSNFYPSQITVNVNRHRNETFPTVEHAYHYFKIPDNCPDPKWWERIRTAPSAAKAKAIGRRCPIRENWDDVKIPVMKSLLELKFYPGTQLAQWLLATGDLELIEGNTWGDRFWGVCYGVGDNHLGRLLMQHRAALRHNG